VKSRISILVAADCFTLNGVLHTIAAGLRNKNSAAGRSKSVTYVHNVMQDLAKTRTSKCPWGLPAAGSGTQNMEGASPIRQTRGLHLPELQTRWQKAEGGGDDCRGLSATCCSQAGVTEVDEAGRIFDLDGTQIKRFGFHMLRHSLATFLMAEGEPGCHPGNFARYAARHDDVLPRMPANSRIGRRKAGCSRLCSAANGSGGRFSEPEHSWEL
jgi:hypothetical protein